MGSLQKSDFFQPDRLHGHPSVWLGDQFWDPADTKIHKCSSLFYKIAQHSIISYTHPPSYVKHSLDFYINLTQCKCCVNSCYLCWLGTSDEEIVCPASVQMQFFPECFESTFGWVNGCGSWKYRGMTVSVCVCFSFPPVYILLVLNSSQALSESCLWEQMTLMTSFVATFHRHTLGPLQNPQGWCQMGNCPNIMTCLCAICQLCLNELLSYQTLYTYKTIIQSIF